MISTSIPTHTRGKPVLYEIRVDLGDGAKPYAVERRYSEFLRLAADFEAEMGEPVAVPPPPKPSLWQSVDPEQRRQDLEVMLTALVRVPEFAESLAVANFLEVYKHRSAARATARTADWVHATAEISRLIGEARSQAAQGPRARQRVLHAKVLAGQLQRELAEARSLGSGERARRQQQLDNYLVALRLLETRPGAGPAELHEAEAALAGGEGPSSEPRVLGETPETRKLNNSGLLQAQEQTMRDQDGLVEDLRAVVARQKELGLAIHSEITKQNELLTELDTDVHRVNARLKEARRKTDRLSR